MSEIVTERLILRDMERSDASDLLSLYSDRQVMLGQSLAEPLDTADDVLALIDYEAAHQRVDQPKAKVIERKCDEAVIGVISVNECVDNTVDIAYYLKKNMWHHGYMSEALKAYCGDVFHHFDIHLITAQYRCDNVKSASVLTACGFHVINESKQMLMNDYKLHDTFIAGLNFEDFKKVSQGIK